MPVWLRKFTVIKLNNYYDEQNNQINKANKNSPQKAPPRGPNIKGNTYTTKARK